MTVDSGAEENGAGQSVRTMPTVRCRHTQVAIDAAARAIIARKGFLSTTISDIDAAGAQRAA
ncbi:hypothetical protein [Mycolicibacterium stellerae]|uniref:hypothetical protein n=1 Tax=Mycolicibacterium stellerae TaxID=2358193 RepID=UPI0038992246